VKRAISGFEVSTGWMHCLKRHNISFRKAWGESGEVNEENIDYRINKSLQGMICGYEPRDSSNVDETALLFTDARQDLDTVQVINPKNS
jgi:hypothetical protein